MYVMSHGLWRDIEQVSDLSVVVAAHNPIHNVVFTRRQKSVG